MALSFCILALLHALFNVLFFKNQNKKKKLPPGPSLLSGNLQLFTRSLSQLESVVRDIILKHGPLVTLKIGFLPFVFISSRSLAHQVLVQHGAVFSDRPTPDPASLLITRNQHNIMSAPYGSTWRLLRRNIASEILHPSRIKSFSWARQWVFGILICRLQSDSLGGDGTVKVVDHFQFSMLCLLVLMCFGEKLDENQVKEIEKVQHKMLSAPIRFMILGIFPRLGKVLFRKRWKELRELIHYQEQVFIPHIKTRLGKVSSKTEGVSVAYVDTLANLRLPEEENRKLTYEEMVALCDELLNNGTDTTSSVLQWIMANLVKYPHIQDKVYKEIVAVVGPPPPLPTLSEDKDADENVSAVIREEDLEKMPYLKAVVLEGLRRHPPGHFVLPHTVTEDVELEGYTVPKNSYVNFMVADMGWDPNVWEDPMEFKPERFLVKASNEDGIVTPAFDITGTKGIKMMPFGAGRRICPAYSMAMLHLEYFVANLLWYFHWNAADGDEVDLSEKQEFTMNMKYPLRAQQW